MERKRKQSNGAYLAICCCAMIVAIVGYANRLSLEEETKPEEKLVEQIPEVSETPEPATKETANNVIVAEKKETKNMNPAPTAETKKTENKKEEIIFTPPIDGNVTEEFSGDDLVYNEALKDWRAHCGVDFEAKIGDDVMASAKGLVESVFDSNMGRCVIIDHQNGFKTMYANLDETDKVKEGDMVMPGDVIGTVGNTALGDITDLEHVHFEMIKEGENVNPIEFLG